MNDANLTILVVDGDSSIREFLEIALSSEGYTVASAGTGASGLMLMATCLPNLILLDTHQALDDLHQFVTGIRQIERVVPVIGLSTSTQRQQAISTLNLDAHVEKPFDLTELLIQIQTLLE
jgi:DNA-binding response OmpR family regulator